MTEPVAIICPDSSVPEKKLKVILSFFESVKIGRPWFVDQPVPLSQSGAVEILRPPQNLKPSGEFKGLLAEYREWIRTSHDKGFDAFVAFKEQKLHGDEATWEIRGELRRREDRPDEDRRKNTLKWHLFLHLAQEIEEEGREAEELLRTLKQKDSPLKGVIAEEEPPGPLYDLPEWEGPLMLSEAGINQVLEAWFSLFEEHLSGDVVLLTLSPPIFQHLCEAWEEWGGGSASAEMKFSVPDFSRLDPPELLEAKRRFLDSREGVALREAVVKFPKKNSGMSRGKMDAVDLQDLTGQRIVIRLRHFSRLDRSSANEIVRHLSGKTIGLIRESTRVRNESKSGIEKLEKEGWVKQFVANEPRLSEAVDLYRECGFDVHLEPLPKGQECDTCAGAADQKEKGECRVCFEGVEDQYKIIFTRRRKDSNP